MANGARLVIDHGPEAGRSFPLDRDVVTLGRDPRNTIVVQEPQVSREHARIVRRGPYWVIEDLGSTNGTFVNGMRLTAPYTLSDGDVIGLSEAFTLTFHVSPMGADVTEALPGRPGAARPAPPAAPAYAPPSPAAGPAPVPPPSAPPYEPAPAYVPPAYGAQPAAYEPAPGYPPGAEEAPAAGSKKKWIFLGCGCLMLLAVAACLLVFILDYLRLLPAFFYEPLRWLGLI